jgi:hypothetical protein
MPQAIPCVEITVSSLVLGPNWLLQLYPVHSFIKYHFMILNVFY